MQTKIGVGTVQFGLNYGISNVIGQTSAVEVTKILEYANKNSLQILDTAASYGESESVLGKNPQLTKHFRIVTKTTGSSAEEVQSQFRASLDKLNQPSVYGLLMHRCQAILGPNGTQIYNQLCKLKDQGLVKKIGVSTYHPDEVDEVLARYKIDLIQVPVNLFDQRLIASGRLAKLKELGVEVHARSAFLQGLLLMSLDSLPEKFSRIRKTLERIHLQAKQQEVSVLDMALAFVLQQPHIDFAICGVNDLSQLKELVGSSAKSIDISGCGQFAIDDVQILDPSQWSKI